MIGSILICVGMFWHVRCFRNDLCCYMALAGWQINVRNEHMFVCMFVCSFNIRPVTTLRYDT